MAWRTGFDAGDASDNATVRMNLASASFATGANILDPALLTENPH